MIAHLPSTATTNRRKDRPLENVSPSPAAKVHLGICSSGADKQCRLVSVNDRDDDHTVSECSWQGARGILYFTRKLAEVPPTGKGKERANHSARQRADKWGRACTPLDERSEVGSITELKTDAPKENESKQAELEERHGANKSRTQSDAMNIDQRHHDDRRDSENLDS